MSILSMRTSSFPMPESSYFKELVMPKIKTSRSAAKRFSTTGSGKFRRRRQNLRHILTLAGSRLSSNFAAFAAQLPLA